MRFLPKAEFHPWFHRFRVDTLSCQTLNCQSVAMRINRKSDILFWISARNFFDFKLITGQDNPKFGLRLHYICKEICRIRNGAIISP